MNPLEPGMPCPLCGIRSDLGCRHQPPSGGPPPASLLAKDKLDRRKGGSGRHKSALAGRGQRKPVDWL